MRALRLGLFLPGQTEDTRLPATPGYLEEEAQPWKEEDGDLDLSPVYLPA